jgi:hypothetical protein
MAMGMVQGLLEKSLVGTSEKELQDSLVFIDGLVYYWRTGEKPAWVQQIEQVETINAETE